MVYILTYPLCSLYFNLVLPASILDPNRTGIRSGYCYSPLASDLFEAYEAVTSQDGLSSRVDPEPYPARVLIGFPTKQEQLDEKRLTIIY